jgi:geranylgeranyl pyrophosphate synthase
VGSCSRNEPFSHEEAKHLDRKVANVAAMHERPEVIRSADADVIRQLEFEAELDGVREDLMRWIDTSHAEMREVLKWQLIAPSKYFRPMTVFACYRAMHDQPVPEEIGLGAMLIELVHNVSLIVDDILDHSRKRRGKATAHCRFGNLRALMTAGYIVADVFEQAHKRPRFVPLVSELMKRLGVGECMQWRLRRRPLGIEDWRMIAGEDTGSMFEMCARVGDASGKLGRFGYLLGILYHGCDDVADVRGLAALGGGGDEDLRDGILTLPAALAIRNRRIAELFVDPAEADLPVLSSAFQSCLPAAEECLEGVADEARREADMFARDPSGLLDLIKHTRQLSNR